MTKQCLEIILSEIESSGSYDTDYKIKGQATLAGETATALIEAVLLRACADQSALLECIAPGSRLNVVATPLQRANETLWIIEEVFSDDLTWAQVQQNVVARAKTADRAAILKNLDFLAWVDRCTFPQDFENDLIELGLSAEIALDLRMGLTAQKGRVKTIVELFQDCILCEESVQAIVTYLDKMRSDFEVIVQRAAAVEPQRPHSESEPGF